MKKFLAFIDDAYETVTCNDCPIVFLTFESKVGEETKSLSNAILTNKLLDLDMSQLPTAEMIAVEVIDEGRIFEVVG